MNTPSFKQQLDILIDRELAILRGRGWTFLLLLLQPPLIGYFIGLAWESQDAEETTYFVMAIASLWMGCMNACCVIVRERLVFERERLFDLNILSYLLAKGSVLAVVGTVQVLLMLLVQGRMMRLSGGWLAHGGIFLVLVLTLFAATGLGLAISSFARTSYAAVVTVPILLIPQIIFSEVLLQDNLEKRIPDLIENITITKWSYAALNTLGQGDPDWGVLASSGLVLLLVSGIFLVLSAGKLSIDTSS